MKSTRRGFTLVELLIVLSIIALLMGMLMPAISIIRASAMRANTENLLRKVDTALHGFKADVRAFPFAAGPTAPAGPWGNELAYRLSHRLTESERAKFLNDVKNAHQAYMPGGSHYVNPIDFDQPYDEVRNTGEFGDSGQVQITAVLNRLGGERAAVGVISGNLTMHGTQRNGGATWSDRTSSIISAESRGWAGDYLAGQLEKKEYRLDATGLPSSIIDRYGHEIVYVNPVVNGVGGFRTQGGGGVFKPEWFGFQPRYRAVTDTIDSDIRTTAARAHVADYELWSAGKDGRFHAQRNDRANRDNISLPTIGS